MSGDVQQTAALPAQAPRKDPPRETASFAGRRDVAIAANTGGNTPPASTPQPDVKTQVETYMRRWEVRGGPQKGEMIINGLARDMERLAKQPGGQAVIDAIKQKLSAKDREALTCHLASGENYPRSWIGAMKNASRMTVDWGLGTGPDRLNFGPRTDASADMRNAPGVERARNYFYKKNAQNIAAGKPLDPVTNYKAYFGLKGAWQSGFSPTQQFVGSYDVNITPVKRNGCTYLRFELSNNSSMRSFLYGIGPSYERTTAGPGGNMRQTYWWEESLR